MPQGLGVIKVKECEKVNYYISNLELNHFSDSIWAILDQDSTFLAWMISAISLSLFLANWANVVIPAKFNLSLPTSPIPGRLVKSSSWDSYTWKAVK